MKNFVLLLLCLTLFFAPVSSLQADKSSSSAPAPEAPEDATLDDLTPGDEADEAPNRVAEDYYRTSKHSLSGVDSTIYTIYNSSLNFAFQDSTQDKLSITLIDNSTLDICTTDEYGFETHEYYNIDTYQRSQRFTYVKDVLGNLVVHCAPGSKSLYREHVVVEDMYDSETFYKQFTVDYSVESVEFTQDGRSIKVIGERGDSPCVTVFPVHCDLDSYESILNLYEAMLDIQRTYGDDVTRYASYTNYISASENDDYKCLLNLLGKLQNGKDAKSNFGYALKDLNGDGSDELILMRKDHHVAAIFTMVNGKPMLVNREHFYKSVWIDKEGLIHGYRYFKSEAYSVEWDEEFNIYRLGKGASLDFEISFSVKRDYSWIIGDFNKTYHKMESGTYNVMMNIGVEEYVSLRLRYEPYWMGDYCTADQADYSEYSGLTFIPLSSRK